MAALFLDPAVLTIGLASIGFVSAAWAAGRVALGMEG